MRPTDVHCNRKRLSLKSYSHSSIWTKGLVFSDREVRCTVSLIWRKSQPFVLNALPVIPLSSTQTSYSLLCPSPLILCHCSSYTINILNDNIGYAPACYALMLLVISHCSALVFDLLCIYAHEKACASFYVKLIGMITISKSFYKD